jgi:hypothetical protein
VIPAVASYLVAFGLAWTPLVKLGFPWTLLLLLLPAGWVVGVIRNHPMALAPGLYCLAGLAVWTTISGAVLPGLASMAIALVAWDAAGLSLWLRKADEIRDSAGIWQGLLLRSCGLASVGAALVFAFGQIELSLPFWALVILLLATWAALAILPRVIHPRRSRDKAPE